MKKKTPPLPYRPNHWLFWKAYWIHMRPYLLFISGIAGFSGITISQNLNYNSWQALFVFLVFFLSYGFGQAFTDTFQTDTDSLSAAYRPLSQKLIRPHDVMVISLVGLCVCVLVFVYFNLYNLFFGALSMVGLAGYSYFKKNYWYIGPYLNAIIVGLLPIMGYHCFTPGLHFPKDLMVLVVINFLAYANFVIIGYLKDISADRATGYRTMPVVWGWNATLWIGNVQLAGVLFCFIFFWGDVLFTQAQGLILFILAGAIAIYGQLVGHLIQPKSEVNARTPISCTVRSFLLWNGCAIVLIYPALFWAIILFYLCFEFILYKRPMAHQI